MKKIFIIFPIIIFLFGLAGLFLDGTISAQFPSFEVYSSASCRIDGMGNVCECGSEEGNACRCPNNPDGSIMNCTFYPTVRNVEVDVEDGWLIITAEVYDVSGVFSVVATIEDTNEGTNDDNQKRNPNKLTKNMVCIDCDGSSIGNGTYYTMFSIEETEPWVKNQTYYVDIVATDRIFNSSNACNNESSEVCSDSCPCYWRAASFEIGESEAPKDTNIVLELVNLDLTSFGHCFGFFGGSQYADFPHCIPNPIPPTGYNPDDYLIEAYSAAFEDIVPTPIILKAVLEDENGDPVSNQEIIFTDTKYVSNGEIYILDSEVTLDVVATDEYGVAVFGREGTEFFEEDENETIHVMEARFEGNEELSPSFDKIGVFVVNE